MNLLILCEEPKYENLAKEIATASNFDVEITNIDFNLTNGLKRSQTVLFLGDQESYQLFCNQYKEVLQTKLVLTIASLKLLESDLELFIRINLGVLLVGTKRINDEIDFVISQAVSNIFEKVLKILLIEEEKLDENVSLVEEVGYQLEEIASGSQLPRDVVIKMFHSF